MRHRITVGAFTGLLTAAVVTLSFISPAGASTPHQTSHPKRTGKHLMLQRGHQRHAAAANTTLTWNGGPVAHGARVYLDFWGNQWGGDGNGVQNYLQGFFGSLGSDTMSNVLTQYFDNGGNESQSQPVLAGVWNDAGGAAPDSASASDISAEADQAAAHFGVSGPDVDIFVVSPSGTHPDNFPNAGFCAWHDWNGNVAFTNMPYVLDAGSSCGADSVQGPLDGFSIVGGHEYAEAATDPQPSSGWVDNSTGYENADLCAWQYQYVDSNGYPVQGTWSNAAGGCQ
jgi:hypothetical protein